MTIFSVDIRAVFTLDKNKEEEEKKYSGMILPLKLKVAQLN
jgi:hypothetical protein